MRSGRRDLVLAFDTATTLATCALVRDGEVLGERTTRAVNVLADADELLREERLAPSDLDLLAVGVGPGSFTGLRIGLATARGLALTLDLNVAGVSTLDALAAGAPGAVPVIDARRREVFSLVGGEAACLAPAELEVEPGRTYVGDGAVRYRAVIEEAGGVVPPDESELHLPRARFHAQLAGEGGVAELVEPVYLRVPDAERDPCVIQIRRLQLRDLSAIEEIERNAYPTPWSRAMFAGELAKPSSICLGAFIDERLVAYLVVSRYVDAWHVMNVAVAPEDRRRGIASRLLRELFELTGDDDRRGYTLEVRVSNTGAIALYERLGFESRGVRRGYYTDNREDALIMWRDPAVRDSVANG